MSKKNPAAKTRDLLHRSTDALPSSESLAKALETAMDHLRAYKTRQDDIVRGLGRVQAAIGADSLEAAKAAIEELLARDLKQAKDRVDNGAFALDIAIKALSNQDTTVKDATDALSQMELLVPEAFEKKAEVAPAGSAS